MPRYPVIAGAGQVANKDESSIVHPMTLVERAARAALDRAAIPAERVGGVYTTPLSALTRSDSAAMLAEALGAGPGPRMVSTYSGAASQRLLAAACQAVASGEVDVAVVAGGIADASVRRARQLGQEPPAGPTSVWSQGARHRPDIRRDWGEEYLPEAASGAGLPVAYFALLQSVLDGPGRTDDRAARLGRLMAPFTAKAAQRPDLAWFPVERDAAEIGTASPGNRMVAEPYTKLMCSFPTVDQAAALVVTAGPRPGAIHPVALAAAKGATPSSGWADPSRPPALARAVATVLEASAITVDQVGGFDLYSCFPAAVLVAARELGLADDDPRGLTASGGLPYFGGPGASYSIHGLACLFEQMGAGGQPLGMAVGVGGMLTDFSVGVYSLEPLGEFAARELPPAPRETPTDPAAEGRAVVEAMTVLHDHDGPTEAPVIGRTPAGARFGARLADPATVADLSGRSLVGSEIHVRRDGNGLVYDLP